MSFLSKFQFSSPARQALFLVRLLALLSLLLAAAAARAAAYYSSGPPTVATAAGCGVPATCGGVAVGTAAQLASLTLAAKVYAAATGPVAVRLPLSGTAPAGYRAGMLVSSLGTPASVQTLGAVTLRTYLDNALQEAKVMDVKALQVALLAPNGSPEQLEFTATLPFNQVELELASSTSLGAGVLVQYAYGIGPNLARQVPGYVSRFSSPAGQYSVAASTGLVCANDRVSNPQNAADADLTNYATFSSLATVDCPGQLRVNLEGMAPAGYQAGFVLGNGNNLLDASALSGLALRTYLNGVPQEYAAGAALLSLGVLPSGQGLVSFPATKPFDAVAIERVGAVAALDNLQLYYGVGVAAAPPTQIRSNWSSPAAHAQASGASLLCALCGVSNAPNAADNDLTNFAQLQVGAGVANTTSLRLDLNGGGQAGNRAGMLVGASGLLDADALSRVTLTTYDAAGNVLETHAGSALLALAVLPDGRRTISFNTTRDFASVGLAVSGLASAVENASVYYAFADDSNGTLAITPPAAPLPVQLVSLAVHRLAGAAGADISWTTASELHSARFVVERATNPAAGFTAIGQVAAAGSSVAARQYSLRDAEAASLAGTLYYRLRQLDQDGTATLSKVVVLAASAAAADFSLYPNPGTAAAPVVLSASGRLPAGGTVSVYAGQGQLLRQSAALADGQASLALPTAGLPAGLYYVVLRDAAGHALSTQRLQLSGQ